ncbi:MAG: TlyA family RNA methyltransferase [Rhodobacterales bacterium]|nr:TlyA family RNA methyltransferase [Rhodobacterales bacterium]
MARKVRLDKLLVDRGLAASRLRARELIEAGSVLIAGIPATKVSAQVDIDKAIDLANTDYQWVGRGALKMLGALEDLQVDPADCVCADLGSSTGGFTEVLIEKGATRVYAVDVGKGLLHYRLRDHERIVLMEGVNARHLESLPEPIDLLVGDLSFISFTKIVDTVVRLLRPGGRAVVLVKPQFEVGRRALGKGGKVRSDADRLQAIQAVQDAATAHGLQVLGGVDCQVPGAKAGNVEHFLHLQRTNPSGS